MRSSPTFIRKQITSDDKKNTHTLNRFQNIVIFPQKVNQNSETRWKKNVHPIIQQHIEPHL